MSQYFAWNSEYLSASEVLQDGNQEFHDPTFPGVTDIYELAEIEDEPEKVELDDEESDEEEIPPNESDGIDGQSPTDYPVRCRSISIGSFKIHPYNNSPYVTVNLSTHAISFGVHVLNDSKYICIILRYEDITRVLVHFGRRLPLIFVYTTAEFEEHIRRMLNMDRFVSRNVKIQMITFLINSITNDQCDFLKHCFPGGKKVKEIDLKQAKEILKRSTPYVNRLPYTTLMAAPQTPASAQKAPTQQQEFVLQKGVPLTLLRALQKTPASVQKASTQQQKNRLPFTTLEAAPQTPASAQKAPTQQQENRLPLTIYEDAPQTPASVQIAPIQQQEIPTQNDLIPSQVINLFTYPPPPQTGGITVSTADFNRLQEGRFLNDVIVEFYLKYIFNERLTPSQCEKAHAFNCYFQTRLPCSEPEQSTSGVETPKIVQDEWYEKVKRWTKNMDIFSKDFLIIPLNQKYHWFLAIVCYPGSVPEANESSDKGNNLNQDQNSTSSVNSTYLVPVRQDSDKPSAASDSTIPPDGKKRKEMPCVCIFDSLRGLDRWEIAASLRKYLEMEWRTKKGTAKVFNTDTLPGFLMDCPQQTNHTDCGLYLLQFVQSFFENPFPYFGNPMPDLKGWFSNLDMSTKRREIQNLIIRIYKEQMLMKQNHPIH